MFEWLNLAAIHFEPHMRLPVVYDIIALLPKEKHAVAR